MAYQDDGVYIPAIDLLGLPFVIILAVYFIAVLTAVAAQLATLQFGTHTIPSKVSNALKVTTAMSILTMLCLMAQLLDSSPPIVFWLLNWSSFLLILFIELLNLELFKTLSIMGGYFTVCGISKMQWTLLAWYLIAVGGQYLTLQTLGSPNMPFVRDVMLIHLVLQQRAAIVCHD